MEVLALLPSRDANAKAIGLAIFANIQQTDSNAPIHTQIATTTDGAIYSLGNASVSLDITVPNAKFQRLMELYAASIRVRTAVIAQLPPRNVFVLKDGPAITVKFQQADLSVQIHIVIAATMEDAM